MNPYLKNCWKNKEEESCAKHCENGHDKTINQFIKYGMNSEADKGSHAFVEDPDCAIISLD